VSQAMKLPIASLVHSQHSTASTRKMQQNFECGEECNIETFTYIFLKNLSFTRSIFSNNPLRPLLGNVLPLFNEEFPWFSTIDIFAFCTENRRKVHIISTSK
jgi:hypothetical protein